MLEDVRYAARRLRNHPGYAAAAILALALGIGCTTAIFSVMQAVLLRTLPVPEPERRHRDDHDPLGRSQVGEPGG